MNVSPLGFPIGVTPFSSIPQILEFDIPIPDVFDMEAYFLALVCKQEKIRFICLKYVTDDGSEHAAKDWEMNLKAGPVSLKKSFSELLGKLVQ